MPKRQIYNPRRVFRGRTSSTTKSRAASRRNIGKAHITRVGIRGTRLPRGKMRIRRVL